MMSFEKIELLEERLIRLRRALIELESLTEETDPDIADLCRSAVADDNAAWDAIKKAEEA
jgi:hypothetical protein